MRRFFACALMGAAAVTPLAGAQTVTAEAVDALAERAVETFQPAGLSVAVMDGGEIIYARGFGTADLDTGRPVTPETRFQMASTTKAVAAASLGVLVDEGRLDWDDRVIDHIPEFRMADPWVTREFQVRDLLTHRSGLKLGAGDLLHWPDAEMDAGDVLNALPHLEAASSFRSEFAYDNILYELVAELTRRITGEPWADFVETRIFDAVGAPDCVVRIAGADWPADMARPHGRDADGDLIRLETGAITPGPAGSGVCDARGLLAWTSMVMNDGLAPDGTRVLSERTAAALLSPVTVTRAGWLDDNLRGSHVKSYALGWFVQDHHGQFFASHSGGVEGGSTRVAMFPDRQGAVIVLANESGPAVIALGESLYRLFTVEDDTYDFIAEIASWEAESAGDGEPAPEPTEEAPSGPPSLTLSAYAGVYEDDWYGTVEVSERGDGLYMTMSRSPSLRGPLEHVRFDTFAARWAAPGVDADAYVTFRLGPDGEIEAVAMAPIDPDTDFSYNFEDLDLRPVD